MEAPELQDVLAKHVIPLLPAHTLGALACTSRAVCNLVYSVEQAWRDAAKHHLPPSFHAAETCNRLEIQQQLQQHATAGKNLAAKRVAGVLDLEGSVRDCKSLMFSPNGLRLSVTLSHPPLLVLFDVSTGHRVSTSDLSKAFISRDAIVTACWTRDSKHLVGTELYPPAGADRVHFFCTPASTPHIESWVWQPSYQAPSIAATGLSPSGDVAVVSLRDERRSSLYILVCVIDLQARATLMEARCQPLASLMPNLCWSLRSTLFVVHGGVVDTVHRTWRPLPAGITFRGTSAPLGFSNDGHWLAFEQREDGQPVACFLDLATFSIKHRYLGRKFIAFVGKAHKALLQSDQGRLQVWNFSKSEQVCELQVSPMLREPGFHPEALPVLADDTIVVLASCRLFAVNMYIPLKLSVYDPRTGTAMTVLDGYGIHNIKFLGGCWHPLHSAFVTSSATNPNMLKLVRFA